MSRLVVVFLVLLIAFQLPVAALSAAEGEHFPLYKAKKGDLQSQADYQNTLPLAQINARVLPPPSSTNASHDLPATAEYDKAPQTKITTLVRSTDWLDSRAMVQVEFNVPVDAESALAKMRCTFAEKDMPLRLATKEDFALFHWTESVSDPKMISIAVNELKAFPPLQKGTFEVSEGVKSLDGASTSTKSSKVEMQAPDKNLQLRTTEMTVSPGEAWPFQFLAPPLTANIKYRTGDWLLVDGASATTDMVVVDPPVPNLKIYTYNSGLLLKGDTVPGTTYQVTFKATLPSFGCTLGTDTTATVKVATLAGQRFLQTQRTQAILPIPTTGPLLYPVYSLGAKRLHVKVYAQDPDNPDNVGSVLLGKTIDVAPATFLQTTQIDLTPVYEKGVKAFKLQIEPDIGAVGYNQSIYQDVQITNLGVTAVQNPESSTFFANDRHTGKFIGDASFNKLPKQVLATTKADAAGLRFDKPRRMFGGARGDAGPSAANMEIKPSLAPILQGEETRLLLKIDEPGKLPDSERVTWLFTPRYAEFKPAGFDDFHFGGDHRQHSMCMERSSRSPQLQMYSSPSSDGLAAVAYSLTDFQSPEPLVMQIMARRDGANARFASTSVSDIIHPAALTVGVKTKITRASDLQDGFDLQVESVVCDLLGNEMAAPVTLQLRAKDDGRLLEQCTVESHKSVNVSTFHIAHGEPVILTADVTDSSGKLSKTTLLLAVEYCRGQLERQPRLGLMADKTYYQAGETIHLWIKSPFAQSEGVAIISALDKLKQFACKLEKQSGLIEIPIEAGTVGPFDVMVKLYDTSPKMANTLTEAACAEGLLNLYTGKKPENYGLKINCQSPGLKAGEKASFEVSVKDDSGQAVPDKEVTLQIRRALRVACEYKTWEPQYVNNLTEQSLDDLQPQSAEKVYREYVDALPIGPQSHCSLRYFPARFQPVDYLEGEKGASQTAHSDASGVAKFAVVMSTDLNSEIVDVSATIKDAQVHQLVVAKASLRLPFSPASLKASVNAQDLNNIAKSTYARTSKFGGVIKSQASQGQKKTISGLTMTADAIVAALIREGERLVDNEPETLDNRSARLVTLDCLRKNIAFAPQDKLKKKIEAIFAADYAKVCLLNTSKNGRPHSWIENVDDMAEGQPFNLVIGIEALTTSTEDPAERHNFARRLDRYSLTERVTYMRKPVPTSEADEVRAFTAYALSRLLQKVAPDETDSLGRDELLKQLTAPDHRKSLTVQSLCWLILATENRDTEKPLQAALKAELATRKDLPASNCSEMEKRLLHDTPLIKKALLLNVLAASKSKKDKVIGDQLASQLLDALNQNGVHGDYELAFIAPALVRYRQTLAKTPLTANPADERFVQTKPPANATSQGVSVKRIFEAADSNAHVYQSKDGAWHCNQGDVIRQVITFAPAHPAANLILHDYFAAGLKASKTTLPVANGYNKPETRDASYTTNSWSESNDLGQNELKVYGSEFDTRRFIYDYTLSAVAPGSYNVPPTEIRDPYDRQFFGTSAADKLIIEPLTAR